MSTRQVIGLRREVSSKQERGVRRRKRLMDAAKHFLKTMDPQEVSFKAIAKHADVPEGSAYHFFANKYDLFSALAVELGDRFIDEVSKPYAPAHTRTWQAFVTEIITRSASIYRQDPVARKVLLGTTMPNEVKNADKESIDVYVATVEAKFRDLFDIPDVPQFRLRLLYALTMIDALFELDLAENDKLTDHIVEEAAFMMIGYLSNFLPDQLACKTPEADDE